MAAIKRFAQTTDVEVVEKRMKVNSVNTIKSNNKAANILREYLKEKNQDFVFEHYDEVQLNEVLGHFYIDARKPDGEKYKSTSLENIRHGLNRFLRSPPHNKVFDIIKDPAFQDANQNFKAMMAELKREGLGTISHHPVIAEADRTKLYTSVYLNPETPSGLFNKVHFDIRLYFFRRGCENISSMTKSTFVIKNDSKTGLRFVTKDQDELTKNHRECDKENISPIMPETPGSPYCPVTSFQKYINKLQPDIDRLWQRPLYSFTDTMDAWYAKRPVGAKTLTSFMSDLSKKCGLSKIYTNHSIRATGATMLSKGMYGPSQIMAVTGHKSVQSLTVYQRVDEDEKLKMGQSISEALLPGVRSQLALPSTGNPGAQLALPSTSNPGAQLALPSTSNPGAQLALPSTSNPGAQLALPSTSNPGAQLALPSTSNPGAQLALPSTSNLGTEVALPDDAKCLEGICLNDLFGDFFPNTNVSNTNTAMQTSQKNPTIFNNCQFSINFNINKM